MNILEKAVKLQCKNCAFYRTHVYLVDQFHLKIIHICPIHLANYEELEDIRKKAIDNVDEDDYCEHFEENFVYGPTM